MTDRSDPVRGSGPSSPEDPSGEATGDPPTETAVSWSRLDGRMLPAALARTALSLLPLTVALVIFGADLDRGVRTALVIAVAIGFSRAVGEAFRWWTSRYRVTEERVELRTGVFSRATSSVPLDRIRTVDLKAGLLQRALGLCVVRIGTGRQTRGSAGLRLDAVGTAEGERLRIRLLMADPAAADGSRAAEKPGADELARFRLSRLPYGLLSWWVLGLPVVVLGGIYQLLSTAGIRPDQRDLYEAATERLGPLPPEAAVATLVGGLVILGAAGAGAFSLEVWWRYRLERRRTEGVIALRHGLFTLRSKDLEVRRMHGVELVETVPLRTAGGAEPRAIMTGLTSTESPWAARAEALGPRMSRTEATAIADELLDGANLGDPSRLNRHPPAALRRRRLRGFAAAAVGVLAVASVGQILGILPPERTAFLLAGAVLLLPLAAIGQLAARDAYRNLGNRLTLTYLVIRRGPVSRRTAILDRDGIVGWNFRATLFQRRLDLLDLTATTAAGGGVYSAPDMATGEAVELASRATPGLLDPFLSKE